MKKLLKSLAFLAVAAVAQSAFAQASWIGYSYISANGTWYQAHGTESWAAGGAFDGHDLGTVSTIELGGQIQINANGSDWGSGSADWMHYFIDEGAVQDINLSYNSFYHGEYYNNMLFQTGGTGWSTTSIDVSGLSAGRHTITVYFGPIDGKYEADRDSATLYTAGFMVAGSSPVAETKEAVYTVTATNAVSASGDVPSGSSATYSSTYSTKCQLTKNNSMTLTLSGFAGKTITGLTLSMKSNSSGGAGNLSVVNGANTIASIETAAFNTTNWHGSWSSSYVDVTPSVTETTVDADNNVVITIAATANSLYCQSFTIAYTDGSAAGFSVALDPAADFEVALDSEASIEATPVNPAAGSVSYAWTVDGEAAGGNSYKLALDTSVAGTHEVVCTATDADSETATASVSYKVVVDYATLPFTYSGPWQNVTTVEGLTSEGLGSDYSGGGARFDETGDWLQVKFNAKPGALTYDIKGNSIAAGYVFDVQESADGETWTTVVSYNDTDGEALTATQTRKTNDLSASSRYVRFYYTDRTCNVALYNLDIDSAVFALTLDPADEFTVDQGSEASITAATRNAEGNVTYAWTIDGTPVDTTGSVLALDTTTAGGPYEVVCTATDGAGATATASVSYNVRVPPVVTTYTLVESADDFVVGADYLVVASSSTFTSALKNELNGSRIGVQEVEIEAKEIAVEDPAPIAWQIKAGEIWGQYVLFNADKGVYAAATNNDNKAQLLAYCTNDLAQWTYDLTPTGKFYNVSFPARSLTRNSTAANAYFATYNNSGTAPRLYIDKTTDSQLVNFEANGGTLTRSTMRYVKGDQYPWFEKPVKAGSVFQGWYDAATGGNRVRLGLVTQDDERTLYARWESTQTVKFNPAGGTCDTASKTFDIGGTYSGFPTAEWDGHTFAGWVTSGGVPVAEGDAVTEAVNRTLYARWSDLTETKVVTFDPNGGTCATASLTCYVGGVYPTFPTPQLPGSVFQGWYDGTTRVKGGDIVENGNALTLTARWTSTQTVKFAPNGGTCATTSKNFAMGGAYADLPTPTWDDHSFIGWFTAAGGGTQVKNGDAVTYEASRTLYAQWEGQTYQTVTFDPNGGTCKTASMQVAKGDGMKYPTFPTPKWAGNTFKGWYTDTTYTQRVKGGMDVSDANSLALVAKWKTGAAAASITAFSMSRSVSTARGLKAATVDCTLGVDTVADVAYEVLWTDSLDGEWTVLKRWIATDDGETSVTVTIPAENAIGFFRVVQADEE
jgi:uncharacterized repeat protein (TIGR02543 family)